MVKDAGLFYFAKTSVLSFMNTHKPLHCPFFIVVTSSIDDVSGSLLKALWLADRALQSINLFKFFEGLTRNIPEPLHDFKWFCFTMPLYYREMPSLP